MTATYRIPLRVERDFYIYFINQLFKIQFILSIKIKNLFLGNLKFEHMKTKHPKGLPFLFFTEMWERFGYYLILGIFVLYVIEPKV
jgi:hypothetical protein